MANPTRCRLLIDPPAEGAWNMAVDQALLETAEHHGKVTLRFYRWSQPTLSLGYFQRAEDRGEHPASLDCPLVRRRTGGGAIVHDREITYSLAVPSSNRWATENSQLYDQVHEALIDQLGELGFDGRLYRDTPQAEGAKGNKDGNGPKPFLCFLRRSDGDVVGPSGEKVIGSAQRRLRNSLLQHGSILWQRSVRAPELPGIADFAEIGLNEQQFIEKVADKIGTSLKIEPVADKLSVEETEKAKHWMDDTFSTRSWNFRR